MTALQREMRLPRYHRLFFLMFSVNIVVLFVFVFRSRPMSVQDGLVHNHVDMDVPQATKVPKPVRAAQHKKWLERQKERKVSLGKTCKDNPSLPSNLTDIVLYKRHLLWPYIVDDKYRLIFGYVSKVGSTNWKSAFLVLKGKYKRVEDVSQSQAHDPSLRKLSSYDPSGIRWRLQNYTKFIFVRDPLARVLSAYRDKFEQRDWSFQMGFGRKIIRLYRKHPTLMEWIFGSGVTFEEFVRFVTDENLKSGNMDGHWLPIHSMLLPCSVPVDFIGKLETATEDADHILKYSGLDHLVRFKDSTRNTSHSRDVFNRYYDNLPTDYIRRLYRLYQYDFELFGYTMFTNLKERKQVLIN